MDLFKRILLSLFPENKPSQSHPMLNPAGMFISFVPAKQFFSVVSRRIVENYKLNLFDIALDPFEVKIGFGENPSLKVKDVENYFAYCCVANLNGYRFYGPANMANAVTLISSALMKSHFDPYPHQYFLQFLYSIYLFSFVILSRLKVFPDASKEEQYKRFVECFFSFYEMLSGQLFKHSDKAVIAKIKKEVLKEIQVFFMLFYFYKSLGEVFAFDGEYHEEYYHWLFYDEVKKGSLKHIVNDYIINSKNYCTKTSFSTTEKEILSLIVPADLQIKYIFQGKEIGLVASILVTQIYDMDRISTFMKSFLNGGEQLENFLNALLNHQLLKNNYFAALQKLVTTRFKNNASPENEHEMDEFISLVGSAEQLEDIQIPKSLRQESQMMERMVNFYMTFMGGLWISRGDTFFMRVFRRGLLQDLVSDQRATVTKRRDSLYFYGSLLYNYSKNVFYYKYAFENIRAGKDKFHLPFKSDFKEVYSNMFILRLFDENFVATLFQDFNPRDIKIYIKQKVILDQFKEMFGSKIAVCVKGSDEELIDFVYGGITQLLSKPDHVLSSLKKHLTSQDIYHLKENTYSLDFWLMIILHESINTRRIDLKKSYTDSAILGIFAGLRETLLGFLLLVTHLKHVEKKVGYDIKIDILIKMYLIDVINIGEHWYDSFEDCIGEILDTFKDIFNKWIKVDDNKQFLDIGTENWIGFIEGKNHEQVFGEIVGEDVIRFRGYTKNITYYNKRYLVPNNV